MLGPKARDLDTAGDLNEDRPSRIKSIERIENEALHPQAGHAPGQTSSIERSSGHTLTNSPSKRVFDLIAASTLMLLLAPVFLLIALMVVLDGGPVVYVHRRIGRHGRVFGCLKFRTMRTNAEVLLDHALSRDFGLKSEWEEKRKLRQDPRVTRVGRLLRRTSLDELPQLINVLRGDMSLVGPRPVVLDELNLYYGSVASSVYLSVRPGITGLWQISGRSDINYAQRVALDCEYVANMSLAYDVAVLIRTVPAIVRRSGAY